MFVYPLLFIVSNMKGRKRVKKVKRTQRSWLAYLSTFLEDITVSLVVVARRAWL